MPSAGLIPRSVSSHPAPTAPIIVLLAHAINAPIARATVTVIVTVTIKPTNMIMNIKTNTNTGMPVGTGIGAPIVRTIEGPTIL